MTAIDVSGKYLTSIITIPKKTNLQSNSFAIAPNGDVVLREMVVMYPAGHAGLVGCRLRYNGLVILPWMQNAGFVFDNGRERVFKFDLYCAKPIIVETQNLDTGAHKLYLTAYTETPGAGAGISPYTPPLIVQV